MRGTSRAALAALVLGGAVIVAGGCSDDEDADGPAPVPIEAAAADTGFAGALEAIGTGTVPVGTGYGWIGENVLGDSPAAGPRPLRWAARALGPGGEDLLRDRTAVERRTGVELDSARTLLASAASFTLGVRADGIDASRLVPALRRQAIGEGRAGGWHLFDLGPTSSIPFGSVAEVFNAFGPRIAVRDGTLVVARRGQSRRDLMGRGASPLDDPAVRLSLACLGDVIAARIVPNNFTHAPNSGPELLAFGVLSAGPGAPREMLCAVDPDVAVADDAAATLSESLAPGATDPVTEEPLDDSIASAEVDRLESEGAHAARARIELAPGRPPGFLFGAFVRGSLITYFGVPGPPSLPNADG